MMNVRLNVCLLRFLFLVVTYLQQQQQQQTWLICTHFVRTTLVFCTLLYQLNMFVIVCSLSVFVHVCSFVPSIVLALLARQLSPSTALSAAFVLVLNQL